MSDYYDWKKRFPDKTDEPYYEDTKDDEWLSGKELDDVGLKIDVSPVHINRKELEREIEDGFQAHKVVVQFHDWFFSDMHPNPPSDALRCVRNPEPVFVHDENNIHPSAVDPASFLRNEDDSARTEQYCQQIKITET